MACTSMCPRDNEREKTMGPAEQDGPLDGRTYCWPTFFVSEQNRCSVCADGSLEVHKTILINGFIQP